MEGEEWYQWSGEDSFWKWHCDVKDMMLSNQKHTKGEVFLWVEIHGHDVMASWVRKTVVETGERIDQWVEGDGIKEALVFGFLSQ